MPPFTYTNDRNPYVGSIEDLLLRRGDIEAQRATAVGNAQARAAEQSGQAWAGATSGMANAVGGVLQQAAQEKRDAPIRAQEATIRDLNIQQARGQIAGQQRAAADQGALDTAVGGAGHGLDPDAIEAALPGHLRLAFRKSWNDAEEAAAKLQKTKAETTMAQADYFGALAAGVKPFLGGEDGGMGAVQIALQHAKAAGFDDADALSGQLQQNPAMLPQLIDSLIAKSPTQRKMLGEEADRSLRAQQEQRAIRTADQTAADREADNRRQDAAAAETRRHDIAGETAAAAAKNDVTDLTPAGLDMAALNYKKTGVMPALGNGDKTTRKRIIDRAATLTPADTAKIEAGGNDIASSKADYKADSDSLKKLQAQRDAIGAFEQTASKNIDIFLGAAGKIVDTGSPLLNAPVRMVTGKLLGAPDQAAYDAARQVAINEIAKITSNPNLSGTLSDSARHEVDAFNPANATLKQTIAVMKLLKQDMANRTTALDAELGTVRGRMKSSGGAKADPLGIR